MTNSKDINNGASDNTQQYDNDDNLEQKQMRYKVRYRVHLIIVSETSIVPNDCQTRTVRFLN